MRSLRRRLAQLEDRTSAGEREGLRLVAMRYGAEFALDLDRCAEILGECGFVGNAVPLVLNLVDIPFDLNANELETYLRENAEQVCKAIRR
jgi:hypothetical protein